MRGSERRLSRRSLVDLCLFPLLRVNGEGQRRGKSNPLAALPDARAKRSRIFYKS